MLALIAHVPDFRMLTYARAHASLTVSWGMLQVSASIFRAWYCIEYSYDDDISNSYLAQDVSVRCDDSAEHKDVLLVAWILVGEGGKCREVSGTAGTAARAARADMRSMSMDMDMDMDMDIEMQIFRVHGTDCKHDSDQARDGVLMVARIGAGLWPIGMVLLYAALLLPCRFMILDQTPARPLLYATNFLHKDCAVLPAEPASAAHSYHFPQALCSRWAVAPRSARSLSLLHSSSSQLLHLIWAMIGCRWQTNQHTIGGRLFRSRSALA